MTTVDVGVPRLPNVSPTFRPRDMPVPYSKQGEASSSRNRSPPPTSSCPVSTPSRLPVDNLPVELLSTIFTLGREAQLVRDEDLDEDDRDPQKLEPAFEVVVSHVCRHWRHVALNHSSLWRYILFKDTSHISRGVTYVARSRKQPLDIVIDTPTLENQIPGVTISRQDIDTVADIIIPESHRLRSVRLMYRDEYCKNAVSSRIANGTPAPLLEHMELYYFEDWKKPQRVHICCDNVTIFGGVTPRLRELSIIGVAIPWMQSRTWIRGLRSLQIKLHANHVRPSFEAWRTMLADSPNLEKLSLHYSGPREDDVWTTPPITVPSLVELDLGDMGCDYLLRFFDHFSAPNVTTLRVELDGEEYTAFMKRASRPKELLFPLLENLYIRSLDCDPAALRDFTMLSIHLKYLDINCRSFSEKKLLEMIDPKKNEAKNDHVPGGSSPPPLFPAAQRAVKLRNIAPTTLEAIIEFEHKSPHPFTLHWQLETKIQSGLGKVVEDRKENFAFFVDPEEEEREDEDELGEEKLVEGSQLEVSLHDEELTKLWLRALPPTTGQLTFQAHPGPSSATG